MKIYRLSNFKQYNRDNNRLQPEKRGPRYITKKAAGGEDMVEISLEAKEKWKNQKSLTLAKSENNNIDYIIQNIKEQLKIHNSERKDKITELKESIQNSSYDFNDENKISKSSENILSL